MYDSKKVRSLMTEYPDEYDDTTLRGHKVNDSDLRVAKNIIGHHCHEIKVQWELINDTRPLEQT